ncbi:serine/threonine-protein phosphatase 2A 56 kDa regulatory subunit epsilon isoform [Tritrichomonas foetus]|uniref:Serine/threonine-protein phosphatase 2A 56 kDa regulatory subunit epsilon isoform n=1 Tax=Tritrichomonas foetus TaxID=1144522 RepID=A0A1J4JJ07_9EUKA|nr:serine/threonine-protein phosphatase 2A 56 kDa regulatory subunit epsilon isoform [Tritrichomonas foetus]|eukprot:OHS97533.1 serine/threonine-protein phosphatase 2A 56 kDa regulatory subunit epsilon isoform [Tritrichomonas foetus]
MQDSRGIKVLPLIRIPQRPALQVPIIHPSPGKTKTPKAKKLPPIVFPKTLSQPIRYLHQPESVPNRTFYEAKPSSNEVLAPINSGKDSEKGVDVNSLLRSCFHHLSFKYVNVYSLSDLPKNHYDRNNNNDRHLALLVQHYSTKSSIEERQLITKYVMQYIIHDPPKYETPNLYSEISPIFAISNSQELEKIHDLFQKSIKEGIAPIGRKFLYQIIQLLDTNVDFERQEVEKELFLILQEYHVARPYMLRFFLGKLEDFHENLNSYPPFCIAPILRIFVFYFANIIKTPSRKAFLTFKTVFFPLYSNPNLSLYEKPLREVTNFFLQKDPSISSWCLQYLCKHWPLSSPRKEMAFLQQLENVISFMETSELARFASLVSQKFTSCIASDATNVSLSAMLLLTGNQLLSFFDESQKPIFLDDIIPALEKTSKHWKKQLSEMAADLLAHLKEVEPAIKSRKNKDQNRTEIWKQIKEMAK